jgi:hypothetical protein
MTKTVLYLTRIFEQIVHIVQQYWVYFMNHAYRQGFYDEVEFKIENNDGKSGCSPGCHYCDPGSCDWQEPSIRMGSPRRKIVSGRKKQREK